MFSLNLTPIKRSSAREKTSSDQQQSCSELKSFSFSEDSSRVGEEPASYRGAVNAQGEMEGQGKIEFAEGGSYVGEFYRNKLHGYGKLFFPSGRLAYEGYFHQNKFHRYGKIFVERPVHVSAINFLDFCPAEQTRVFDVETHRGKVEETIWKYYEGEIQLGKRHGKGVLMFENGERFEGQFQDGEVHGSGIFYGKSGTVHGSWCHNKMTQ